MIDALKNFGEFLRVIWDRSPAMVTVVLGMLLGAVLAMALIISNSGPLSAAIAERISDSSERVANAVNELRDEVTAVRKEMMRLNTRLDTLEARAAEDEADADADNH